MRYWRKRLLSRIGQVIRETEFESQALRRCIVTLANLASKAHSPRIVIVHNRSFVLAIRLLRLLRSVPQVEIHFARTIPEIDQTLSDAVATGNQTVFVSRFIYQTIRIAGLDARYRDKLILRTA